MCQVGHASIVPSSQTSTMAREGEHTEITEIEFASHLHCVVQSTSGLEKFSALDAGLKIGMESAPSRGGWCEMERNGPSVMESRVIP